MNRREEVRYDHKDSPEVLNFEPNDYQDIQKIPNSDKVKLTLDPNRDFPYHLAGNQCLMTVTARTVYHEFS
jgi:hypothetical protein